MENSPVDKGLDPPGYYGRGSKEQPFTAVDIRPAKPAGARRHDDPAVLQKIVDEDDEKMSTVDPDSHLSRRQTLSDQNDVFKTFKDHYPIDDDMSDLCEITDSIIRAVDKAGVVHSLNDPNNYDHVTKTFKILTRPFATHSTRLSDLYAKSSVFDQLRITAIVAAHQMAMLSAFQVEVQATSDKLEAQLEVLNREIKVLEMQDRELIAARRKCEAQKAEAAQKTAFIKNAKNRAVQARLEALNVVPKKKPVAVSIHSDSEDDGSGSGDESSSGESEEASSENDHHELSVLD